MGFYLIKQISAGYKTADSAQMCAHHFLQTLGLKTVFLRNLI